MHATPLMMPRRRTVLVPTAKVAYSTSTGDQPRRAPGAVVGTMVIDLDEAYCFVCGRCTDHVGEHDALVEAGLASYDADGVVRRTADWDADKAKVIAEDEYRAYCARLGLTP